MSEYVSGSRLKITVDDKKLKEQYEIYNIRKDRSEKNTGNLFFLDAMAKDILAVSWSSGTSCFVLLKRKEENRARLSACLKKSEDFYFGEEEPKDRIIASLLLNALNYSSYLNDTYANSSGRLKVTLSTQKGIIRALDISIDQYHCLHLDVETYTASDSSAKKRYHKRAKKAFDDPSRAHYMLEDGILRKIRPEEKQEPYYVKLSYGKKGDVPFLNWGGEEKFRESKMGILQEIMKEFRGKYGDICALSYEPLEILEDILHPSKVANQMKLKPDELLSTLSFSIEDTVCDEKSKEIAAMLTPYTSTEAMLTLRIIHEKEYYEEREEKDQHKREIATQHVTVEHMNTDLKGAAWGCVFKEMHVRQDIIQKHYHSMSGIMMKTLPSSTQMSTTTEWPPDLRSNRMEHFLLI